MAEQTEVKSPSNPLNYIIGVIALVGGAFLAEVSFPLPGGIPLNVGVMISTIGIVLILFPVIKMFYIQPLATAINDRNGNLEKTFAEAEDLRNQMDKMRSDYERRLAETEADARAKIQAQIKEAQTLRQKLEADAVARADELIRRAEAEIAAERDRVLTQLRVETVNLALSAAEKLLGENMDTDRNRKLVEEFITKVEVPS